ncbi:MAG: MATE family efflux transporter [Anaerolineae bacterium]
MNASQTRITKGDLSTLVRISLPVMFFLSCETIAMFCERIFLSHYSPQGVHCSLNATYLANIFQSSCMAIGVMAQVFVGRYQGSSQFKKIGPCIWQLIWFSFLSLLITLPLGLWSSALYFKDSSMQKDGTAYFTILAIGNFLFPLNTSLASFYIGRGKTLFVTSLMVIAYALHLLLCWPLIFGVGHLIPALGIPGAALAKCLSLGLFCFILFSAFLRKKNRESYATDSWQISLAALWSYIQPGTVRAFGIFWTKISWSVICYFMIKKGDTYLNVQTIGGTIITFLMFISTGMYRAILTIASNLMGAKNYSEIWRLCRSLIIYLSLIALILAIPLLAFPDSLIYFFTTSSHELFEKTFKMINHWVWLYLTLFTIQMSFCALIVATGDFKIQFFCYFLSSFTSLLPVYLMIYVKNWEPDKLWAVMALENVVFMLIYFYRFQQRKWQERQQSSFSIQVDEK